MRRFVQVVAVSAVSAAVLAGCGSSGAGGAGAAAKSAVLSPSALVAASYSKVSEQKTAKLSLSFALTADGQDVKFDGSGVQDFVNKKADITINDPSGQQIEERLLGTTIYVKLPKQAAASSPALQGKTWLKEDLTKAAQAAGIGSGGDTGANSDPSQILQMLSSVSDQVSTVGPEPVRGVDTTHYHVVVDLTKASAKQGSTPEQATRLRQLLGTNTMPVDLWIDKDGLPHRMQFQLPLPKALAQQGGLTNAKMVATEELFDFGTPVDVQAPPAGETVDASTITGGTGSASSGTKGSGQTA